jgi:hypothetical protein
MRAGEEAGAGVRAEEAEQAEQAAEAGLAGLAATEETEEAGAEDHRALPVAAALQGRSLFAVRFSVL